MSDLSILERTHLEKFLGMSGGYVLGFSDYRLGEFIAVAVGLDIHSSKYCREGTSKAKKLRAFWKQEPDHIVGKLILLLIDYYSDQNADMPTETSALADKCKQIAMRLLAGGPSLESLKHHAGILNANHLKEQIRRMEDSLEDDPSLAIGTAKELIETCCKTILAERGKPPSGTPDISVLTKETLRELKLVPEGVPDATRGSDVIKRVLSNLGAIGNGLAELRGLYGTGHGKHGRASGLGVRHAKLAVGAAATLSVFLFETHKDLQ